MSDNSSKYYIAWGNCIGCGRWVSYVEDDAAICSECCKSFEEEDNEE